MKRMCKILTVSSVLLIFLSLSPLLTQAQIGDPGDPGEDPDAPIDGGVSILVAAGIGYGLKKANDRRKKSITIDVTEMNK